MDKKGILNRQYIKELSGYISDPDIKNISVGGLYASAKSFALSSTVTSGIHIVILHKREEAAGFINDPYNLLGADHVFFFPPSNVFSTTVKRTATMCAVVEFNKGVSPHPYIVLVGYKESFDEGVLEEKLLKKSSTF